MIREWRGQFIQNSSDYKFNKMKILINGKEKDIGDNILNLNDFIDSILKNDKGKIIELNGKVIKKNGRKDILLKEGDRIELIQFMGGG